LRRRRYDLGSDQWCCRIWASPSLTAAHRPLHFKIISLVGRVTRSWLSTRNFYLFYGVQLLVIGSCIVLLSAIFFVLIERPCMERDWPQRLLDRLRGNRGNQDPGVSEPEDSKQLAASARKETGSVAAPVATAHLVEAMIRTTQIYREVARGTTMRFLKTVRECGRWQRLRQFPQACLY
jgi:hypothetical protein